jgi:hypothetical protein
MDWPEALELVILRTGHERYRDLCADEHPDHEEWRRKIIARATGRPVEQILAEAKAEGIASLTPPRQGCCG